MKSNKLTVQTTVQKGRKEVWDYYTKPRHITQWNFADPSWHCPSATNNMIIGGEYIARMEAKDGSFGFDFQAIYSEIKDEESFTYGFGGRECSIDFRDIDDTSTAVTVTFDPEEENTIEMQQNGWQIILNNFKKYAESQ